MFSKIPNSYKEESTIVAENIKRYVSKRSDSIVKIYKKCLENYTKSTDEKEDKKNFVNYVSNNHKKDLSFLANLYNGNTNNYLISRSGRQIKYKDILKWLSENP